MCTLRHKVLPSPVEQRRKRLNVSFWPKLVSEIDWWISEFLTRGMGHSKSEYTNQKFFTLFLVVFCPLFRFVYTWKSENGRNFENVQDKFHPTETKEVKNQWIQGESLQQSLGYFIILSEFFTRSACHLKVLCRKRIKNTKKGVKIYEMTHKKREKHQKIPDIMQNQVLYKINDWTKNKSFQNGLKRKFTVS